MGEQTDKNKQGIKKLSQSKNMIVEIKNSTEGLLDKANKTSKKAEPKENEMKNGGRGN